MASQHSIASKHVSFLNAVVPSVYQSCSDAAPEEPVAHPEGAYFRLL
jgi:hypothetical protein